VHLLTCDELERSSAGSPDSCVLSIPGAAAAQRDQRGIAVRDTTSPDEHRVVAALSSSDAAEGAEISWDVNETERLLHDQELGVLGDPTSSVVIW